jgi:hypothetical protein
MAERACGQCPVGELERRWGRKPRVRCGGSGRFRGGNGTCDLSDEEWRAIIMQGNAVLDRREAAGK